MPRFTVEVGQRTVYTFQDVEAVDTTDAIAKAIASLNANDDDWVFADDYPVSPADCDAWEEDE